MSNPGRRPGEVFVGNLKPGTRFKLDLGKSGVKNGVVLSQSAGQTIVKFEKISTIETVLGEELPSTSGAIGVSTHTVVIPT